MIALWLTVPMMVQCVGLGVPRRVRRCWRGATASHQGQDSRQLHFTPFDKHVTQFRQAKGISRYRQHRTWIWWFSCDEQGRSVSSSRTLTESHHAKSFTPRTVRQLLSALNTGTRSTRNDLYGYKSVPSHMRCASQHICPRDRVVNEKAPLMDIRERLWYRRIQR